MALWDGQYWYNGLQVQVNKAMSHSFEVGGSYTYSKNMDTGGGSVASDPFRNSISSLLWFCPACRRGLSDQDQRHNLTVHYEWDIPTPSSFGTPAKAILGQLGSWRHLDDRIRYSIYCVSSRRSSRARLDGSVPIPGQGPWALLARIPSTPRTQATTSSCSASQPQLISTQLGNAGRNSAIGPGLIDMDFSLYKNIPIHEALKAQFRAEFFNIMNRPNFNSPNDNRVILNPDGSLNPDQRRARLR